MERPANVNFLTAEENLCLEYLLQAQDLFDRICTNDPQSTADSYNFGHYVDAARNAILIRGCRRMDPTNLLKQGSSSRAAKVTPTMQEHMRSTENDKGELGSILDTLKRGENPTIPPEG